MKLLQVQPLTYLNIGNTVVIRPRPSLNTHFATHTVAMAPPLFEIHGRVVNQQGQPLQNVSVLIAGTRLGTSTNSDGRFTLTAPDDKNMVLEISSVGYQTKRGSVGKQGEIKVVLETDVGGLDDVVVMGYGSRKRKDLIGAVSNISSKDI